MEEHGLASGVPGGGQAPSERCSIHLDVHANVTEPNALMCAYWSPYSNHKSLEDNANSFNILFTVWRECL